MKKILALLLVLACLAGSALAADISQIRGFDKDLEYQYLILGSYPYEEDGTVAPLTWRVLNREGDQATLITEYLIDNHQMILVDNYNDAKNHKFSYKNLQSFEETDLYAWVNSEMEATILQDQDFSAAIVLHNGDKFWIMDYADLMNTDYGFPHTKSGNTVEQEGEVAVKAAKYRKAYGTPYAKAKVLYEDWSNKKGNKLFQFAQYGNSSPYWCSKMRLGYYMAGIVGGNGHLSWSGMGDVQKGVRPAVIVDLSQMTVTGGDGSLENPWIMAPAEGTAW
ncbi:MAG: hypothetical protein IJ188_06195 [Clostridia bacterium]|nr:hypothetical protein [Clostridia bacterium]MBQ9252207.1 hypothetical protein [Clostridia bacterium]